MRPEILNLAFPRMVAPEVTAGDTLSVAGVRADGPMTFAVPECPLLVKLRFGARAETRSLGVDQVGIEADKGRFFVSYRFPFRYTVRPREIRECMLVLR